MGQLVRLYAAPNAYLAAALAGALRDADVPCVQFSNEIPMFPGLNFGAAAYADILIDDADAPRARAVLDEVRHALCGVEPGCERKYPSTVSRASSRTAAVGFLITGAILFILAVCVQKHLFYLDMLGLQSGGTNMYWLGDPIQRLLEQQLYRYCEAIEVAFWLTVVLGLTVWNWPIDKRTARSAATGLCALPVATIAMSGGLLRLLIRSGYKLLDLLFDWLLYLPQWASGKPKH